MERFPSSTDNGTLLKEAFSSFEEELKKLSESTRSLIEATNGLLKTLHYLRRNVFLLDVIVGVPIAGAVGFAVSHLVVRYFIYGIDLFSSISNEAKFNSLYVAPLSAALGALATILLRKLLNRPRS